MTSHVDNLPQSEALAIPGPAGKLEALAEWPADGEVRGVAVVLHPHPQHGGTMHNKVTHTLARSFVRSGFAVLRFNFRGTEGSEGRFDHGVGELADAKSAIAWITHRHLGVPLWLAGFSFGAAIAVRAALDVDPAGLVTVAPAIHRFANDLDEQPRCPWLIVQGDEDELVAVDETVEWVDSLEPGPELLILNGAEHFLHGRLSELRAAVMAFVADD